MSEENKGIVISRSWIGAVILGIILNAGSFIYAFSALSKDVEQLLKRPPLLARVIKLEVKLSEHGRILSKMENTLDKINKTMDDFGKEQSRRTPFIEIIKNKHLKD